uniref:Tail spike head-binding protein n=1 Tax=Serratia phage Kevin TaxID=3161161 RepID=A0AAU8KX16_9CAUD
MVTKNTSYDPLLGDVEPAKYNRRGSFQNGTQLTQADEIAFNADDNNFYLWAGSLPKDVPSGSTPATTGGVSPTTWVNVGDGSFRSFLKTSGGASAVGSTGGTVQADLDTAAAFRVLLASADGAKNIGAAGGGKVQDYLGNFATPEMYGAKGDGTTDDTVAIQTAMNTGKNVHCRPGANYKVSGPLTWPWKAQGTQTMYGYDSTITSLTVTNQPVFMQTMADNTVATTTVRKSYYNVNLIGPVRAKDRFATVAGTDGFWLQDGKLINCSIYGFSTGASIMGNVTVQAFYADQCRNAGLRSQGSYNRVYGLNAGWTAGDTLIVKSDYSYYADIWAEYAGVIPKVTDEPGPQQGSLISFAQDGNNAGGNIINGAGCRYYGAGAITINGFDNHVGGALNIGQPADTSFAAVDRYDPALYVGGTDCSLGNVDAKFVYGGLHLHNGSVNCRIGIINLGTVSDLNSNCQAFVASGTCTNCKVDGVYASGVAKGDSVYISMADLHVNFIKIRALNTPNVVVTLPIRILSACSIGLLHVDCNLTSASTINTVFINGAARIGELEVHGAFGASLIVEDHAKPVLGRVLLNPRSDNTTRCAEFRSSDASDTRFIGSLTIVGTTQPRANGIIQLGAYRGDVWRRNDAAQTLSVRYPDPVDHAITT